MSIQLATAPGALLALGLGAGDVASLIALGKRVGNWWTTQSGDQEMLSFLDQDEHSVITRRGLLDIVAFNARWRNQINLLANGRPLRLHQKDVRKVMNDVTELLQDMSLFTSTMVCIVAALDQFANEEIVNEVLYNLLMTLLKPGTDGEDIVRSQYRSRINAWRSTSSLRGFNLDAQQCRLELIEQQIILNGHFPHSESRHVLDFLLWLLGTTDTTFRTSSSDVAGIAACLCYLGMDIIGVEGRGFSDTPSAICNVVYSDVQFFHEATSTSWKSTVFKQRDLSTTIPLEHPEESISVFPISKEAQNKCRAAWKAGMRAASTIKICIRGGKTEPHLFQSQYRPEIQYQIVDVGSEVERTSPELYTLAENYGLVVNGELLKDLEACLGRLPNETLTWLNATTLGNDAMLDRSRPVGYRYVPTHISDPDMTDQSRVEAFCIFQSFFLGNYYELFHRVVDTKTLACQVVEGCWAFRSPDLIQSVHMILNKTRRKETESDGKSLHIRTLTRQDLLELLLRLFLGSSTDIPQIESDGRLNPGCVGVIGKRTILINSLLGKCSSPSEIGGFTILDVDVGGIPRDSHGLVRPGYSSTVLESKLIDSPGTAKLHVNEEKPDKDVEFGIEADWEADPDTALVCARYKGRRVATLSPAMVDYSFCKGYVPPGPKGKLASHRRPPLDNGIGVALSDIMTVSGNLPLLTNLASSVLFQALDRPRLRYVGVSLYSGSSMCICKVATDSVQAAKDIAASEAAESKSAYRAPTVIIAGLVKSSELDFPIASKVASFDMYEIDWKATGN
ncbi:hypothetical protein F4808DRAFT_354985 [Astrocystis sublimbata]|nr:hypothetical protein F4808DRAFT_354985 [Astrocystis sublimbata]